MNQIHVPLNIQLHANQKVIQTNQARFKVIKAGKRFGKTYWALFELLQWAGLTRRGNFWYIAQTFGQAKDTAWGVLHDMLPYECIEKEWQTELRIQLKLNGSMISLKGQDNPDTLRGTGLHGAVFDERAYHAEGIWPRIVRGQLANTKGRASFISSPHEKGRNHYTNFCEEAKRRMDAGDKDWFYAHFTIYDNPTIERSEIEDLKNSVSDDVWNLEYMAEESGLGGILYKEFDYDRNVADLDNESFHYSILAMDYGLDHPAANLWMKVNTEKKIIYVQDELVKSGELISSICEMTAAKTKGQAPQMGVLDPSSSRRDPFTKRSYIDEYRRCFRELGGDWESMGIFPGDNKTRGYDITRRLLNRGVIKIHPRCRTLIYQLKTVTYDSKIGEDATDAGRYGFTFINDRISGMNVLPKEEENSKTIENQKNGVYSLHDPLFSQNKVTSNSWVMNEYV